MKILLVPTPPDKEHATVSGVHKYLYELAHSMDKDVEYVFVHSTPSNTKEKQEDDSVSTKGHGFWVPEWLTIFLGYLKDIRQLSARLKPYKNQVDLIHVVAGGCEIYTIAAKLAGFKHILNTIQAMHGVDKPAQHWVRRLIEKLSFKCTSFNIVVSDATYEDWHKRVGLKKDACITIFNSMQPPDLIGYDRSLYRSRNCADQDQAFLIGICARLHHMKGHVVLLHAFKKLITASTVGEKTRLLIAGDGPERENIENTIRDLGLEAYVVILGHTHEPVEFIASLDLHVMPSLSIETIGYANIEAMFTGVPCIVSDVGGAKEIVSASGGGRVIEAGDVDALCKAMREFIDDPELCHSTGAKGKEYAQKNLTAKSMAERTLKVYRDMLQ